jgi:hypothetical protein
VVEAELGVNEPDFGLWVKPILQIDT